nr:PAS domain-containing sensor histidine kinase [uncultured Dongia sp.]
MRGIWRSVVVAQKPISLLSVILIGASFGVAIGVGAAAVAPNRAYAAFFDNMHWTIATVAAAWMGWLGYFSLQASGEADARARLWFARGLTAYAIGQVLWDIQVASGWNPFPAPSDLFYMLMGPCCAIGFITAFAQRAGAGEGWAFGLDAAALSVGVLAVTFSLYLQINADANILQLGVLVTYPVSFLSPVCCGLVLVLMTRPRAAVPWIMMLVSLTAIGFIWMLWNALVLDNAIGSGKGMNAMFSAASLLCGYAAANWRLQPSASLTYARLAATSRYLLPMVLVLLACTAIILITAFPNVPRALQFTVDGASILVVALAVIRQSFLLKERDLLLRAESKARQVERRMRIFFEATNDPIFVCRVERGRFVYEELNAAALAIIGKQPGEFQEMTPHDVMPADLADKVCGLYRQCVASGEPMRYEYAFDSPTGVHWFDTRLLPVRDAKGRITHLHGISRSVTDLKQQTGTLEQLAKDLDRARRDAESANRAKSMFLAKMSHELRTPLNAILGFTEVMDRQVFGPVGSERYAGYLKDIHSSGHMLLLLVNDVLDLSKLEAGQYQLREESVDLGEIAAETCAMLEQQAQSKGIKLSNIRRPLPRVMADRRAISQILVNLVANGLKFTPSDGSVDIIIDRGVDGSPQLVVRDTGMGIPQHEIDAVRQAFVQGSGATRSAEAGTGLGLTIVCSMAELHGGAVTIDSEIGKGTTVTVRLPASRMLAA